MSGEKISWTSNPIPHFGNAVEYTPKPDPDAEPSIVYVEHEPSPWWKWWRR